MNTSGPSSRPRKPYPLALLNHLTVPVRRSTCAPSSCGSQKQAATPKVRKKCVGIVLLIGEAVKVRNHTRKAGLPEPATTKGTRTRDFRFALLSLGVRGLFCGYPCSPA